MASLASKLCRLLCWRLSSPLRSAAQDPTIDKTWALVLALCAMSGMVRALTTHTRSCTRITVASLLESGSMKDSILEGVQTVNRESFDHDRHLLPGAFR